MLQKRICQIILFCMIFLSIEPSLSLAEEVTTGGAVFLGHYEQDGLIDSAEEPIEWIVLSIDKRSDKVLIVSKYLLDCRVYNTSTKETAWKNSSIRNWLNSNFYDSAFTQEEKQAILSTKISNSSDNVFLLNSDQIKKLLSTEICYATPYAKSQGVYVANDTGTSSWWVQKNTTSSNGVYVGAHGKIYEKGNKVTACDNGIRPAMYVSYAKIVEISNERLLGNTQTNEQITPKDNGVVTGNATDKSGQVVAGNTTVTKRPFYADKKTEMETSTKEISEIFTMTNSSKIRTDGEALDYYLSESGAFGESNYVVFSNGRISLIRKGKHIFFCNFVSSNVVKPKAILMDIASFNDAQYHEEYYFAFQDGFVFVDEVAYQSYKYKVYYYSPKENSIRSFEASSLCASLDETLFAFADVLGRIVYFDVINAECGIMSLPKQVKETIYASRNKALICLTNNNKYYFIDFIGKKAYNTQLPQNTIYADENVYVTNDEFSLKLHTANSTNTLVKKSDYYQLQDAKAWYYQYGNVLALPNETVYVFNDGRASLIEKSSGLRTSLDRVHRFATKSGTINQFYTQFYDKKSGTIKDISQLPKDFKTDISFSMSGWTLFCNPESLVFTPTASLANNYYLLQRMGYYVYNVDNAVGTYITIKLY